MNSSAELRLALGGALAGAHLDRESAPPAAAAKPAVAHDPLAQAHAEIARLQAQLAASGSGSAALEALARRVDAEMKRMEAAVAAQVLALEGDVVGLALAVAGKVLRREITSPSFDLGAVVHEALGRIAAGLSSDKTVHVKVSSHDLQTLDKSTRVHPSAGERVHLEVDPQLGPAQVVLECELRRVVVDVRAEFERLKTALLAEDEPHA